MHIIIAVLGAAALIFYWILRAQSAARAVRELDRDTRGLRSKAKYRFEGLIGSRYRRIRDPRLAATVLMIQLVRTGTPLTMDEKLKIIELISGPLQIDDPDAMFKRAWQYTKQRGFFSPMADEMVPMLRDRLTMDERFQLIDMLRQTASAYGEASELQTGMISRLKRQLVQV
ncbi:MULTISPECIES: TerB family tellurite resistance protein [unclassified Phyllobacterium]|uniref:TerB family tellurite resistance protein n=1 Tax=Phyllobacterium TaxID=28100 RepID=UPI000DD80926|nr:MULTISPECIES: TerB family tellurite resistance protein [unclassified Phyllobacterium]MBA8900262.1 putative tellurite resistance protein B-like protein [Phyllobacterium sp. P30BS-XVII]UGX86224.1 TerB family tellurite resistance protein [Phyllobacterium sp. T1293]